MIERETGWYKLIDKEGYLSHDTDNVQIVEEYFNGDKVFLDSIEFNEGWTQGLYTKVLSKELIISANEWEFFEECEAPYIGDTLEKLTFECKEEEETTQAPNILLEEVLSLIANSDGVAGLHLNGEVATWRELVDGGWLTSLEGTRL